MFRKLLLALAVVLIVRSVAGLDSQSSISNRPQDFPNLLSMSGRPSRSDDWPASRFSDLGAWFGYLLPPAGDKALEGGFVGPFLVDEGVWAGLTLAQASLEDDSGREFDAAPADAFETAVFPGRLHQRFPCGGFDVALDLVFVSGRSAVVRATVTNTQKHPRRVGIGWRGEGIEGGGVLTAGIADVRLATPRGSRVVVLPMSPGAARPALTPGANGFRIRSAQPVLLAPGETTVNYLGHVVSAPGEDEAAALAALGDLARAPARAFMATERRWTEYIGSALQFDPAFAGTPAYRVAAVKALMTMLGNWRRPLGGLRHDGLVASSTGPGREVFHAWDSWKHAAALGRFFPELAVSQIRAMFDYQDADGMVAASVRPDSTENNWLNTNPPLAGWAIWEVYRRTGDRSLLHEMQPLLQRYHDWWARRRDRDQDGLCEYGAGADRVDAAKEESGMGRAVRFDTAVMRKAGDRAWTLDVESADLNAFLYAEKRYLAQMSRELLREDKGLNAAATRLQAGIRALMFDPKSGYFHDAAADGGARRAAQGPEGWTPLWAGVATPSQAAAVRRALLDPRRFNTYLPFPSLAADDRRFDPAAPWRGAVSLDQAYFAVQGLRRYGWIEDARRLTRLALDRSKGLTEPGVPIRETYDPLTGEGRGAAGSGPSAAHVLLLLWGQ